MTDERTSVTIEFDRDEYERLFAVSDSPTDLIREAVGNRLDVEEAVAFTRKGGFQGPDGFARIMDDDYPSTPVGALLGYELLSMGDGESRFVMEAGAQHTNPLGTVQGGVLARSVTLR